MSLYIHQNENAIYYECGYSCDNAIFINLNNDKFFITDSRYEIDVKRKTKNIEIIIAKDLLKSLCDILIKKNITNIKIDPREWSYFQVNKIKDANINLTFVDNLSFDKRIIKSDKEISILKQAVKIGADGFDRFEKYIKQEGYGKNEKQLALYNYISMSNDGQLATSFDAIVAINKNSAKPHAFPDDSILSKGDTLLVDAGVKYKRYCSDRTRTVSLNDDFKFDYSQKFDTQKKQDIYDIVLKAHDEAIQKYKQGMRACDIDAICRNVINKAGYGKYFTHSTGHGVGLDIHERPFISSNDKTIIENNMVFTIEPGIYIEDFIGVRIENMVIVNNNKLEII